MSACSNCGRELPEGSLFCPDCGASAVDFSVGQSQVSPSHFNSAMTATAPPPGPPSGDSGFASPPPPYQEESKRSFTSRRGVVLVIIVILAVLLVGTTFETGMLGAGGGAPAVNSATTPFTGGQLYSAYAANEAQATASYTNKTVYIQDSLDFGVATDLSTGQYYSSVNSGTVILIWSGTSSQVANLLPGATVLAKCSVEGVGFARGEGYVLYLQNCDLLKVQSQASTTTSISVSAASV